VPTSRRKGANLTLRVFWDHAVVTLSGSAILRSAPPLESTTETKSEFAASVRPGGGEVLVAYEPRVAGALSGVTQGQLNYWRKEKLFIPEYSDIRPVAYSFRDLVALRTFAMLRGKRSLQGIRRALKQMAELGETDHLSQYRLELQGRRGIVLVRADGSEGIELVEKPGNLVAVIQLGDLVKSFPLDDIEVPNLIRPRENISVKLGVLGGHPVVAGTRVPYELVASLVRDGVEPGQVAEYYPSVSADAARDAVDFAKYVERAARRRVKSLAA
jgi:uncharacterized protein (DUF433 family)/DNA-binding transcriptional MerR regulator